MCRSPGLPWPHTGPLGGRTGGEGGGSVLLFDGERTVFDVCLTQKSATVWWSLQGELEQPFTTVNRPWAGAGDINHGNH